MIHNNRVWENRRIHSNMAYSITLFIVSLLVPLVASLAYVSFAHISDIMEAIRACLKGNQFLQTFIFGSVSGGLMYLMKLIWDQVWGRVYSQFRTDVTIQNTDPAYTAVVDFINENHLKCAQSSMQVNTRKSKKTWKEEIREEMYGAPKETPELDLRPNDDGQIHSFVYRSTVIQFYRKKGETLITGYSRQPLKTEHLNLSCWGTDNSKIMQLIEEAVKAKTEKESRGVSIYVSANTWLSGFELACIREPRDSESVILDAEYAESMLEDARKFLSQSAWYHEMCIPYRRGYLLHGPPGCGKTSFALVLASELKLNICILNLSDKNMDDNALAEILRSAPQNAIILLEDVDSVFLQRSNAEGTSYISFSGLLNAIDGVAAQEGRIFLMTTNHLERLDEALIRPGRCDVKIEVKKASKHQLELMFLRFFPGDKSNAILFRNLLPEDEFSMAEIQGHMLEFGHSADACIENSSKLLNRKRSSMQKEELIYDYLRRASLEMYAPAFEFLGIYDEKGFRDSEVDLISTVCPDLQLDLKSKRMLKKLKEDENVKLPTSSFSTVEASTLREEFLAAYPLSTLQNYSLMAPGKTHDDSYFACSRVNNSMLLTRVESKKSVTEHMDEYDHEDVNEANVEAFLQKFTNGESYYRSTQKTNDVSATFLDLLSRIFVKTLSNTEGKPVLSKHQLSQLLNAYPDRPIQCVIASRNVSVKRSHESYKLQETSLIDFLKRLDRMSNFHKFEGIAKNLRDVLKLYENDKAILEKAKVDESIMSVLNVKSTSPSMSLLGYQIVDRQDLMWAFKSFFLEHSTIDEGTIEEQAYIFASQLSDTLGRGFVSKTQVDQYLSKSLGKSIEVVAKEAHILKDLDDIPELPSVPAPEPEEDYVYEWLNDIFRESCNEDEGKKWASVYGKKFKEQGLVTLNDLKVGPPLDDATLAAELGVGKLGHRLKIVAAHEKMFKINIDS